MHYLQKSILDQLRYGPLQTYTSLMPDDIESSHFRYHLKQLMTEGLVAKNPDGLYALTDKGQQEVDYLSEHRTTLQRTPKPITYTLLTHADTLLLYKKHKEPYRELLGLIGGKLHFGEDAQQGAIRDIHEKTGLTVAAPAFRGIANIRIDKNREPLTHVIAYVYSVELTELPDPMPKSLVPTLRADIASAALVPDFLPILELLDADQIPFVSDIRCRLD